MSPSYSPVSSEESTFKSASSHEALLSKSEEDVSEPVIRRRSSTNWLTAHITLIFVYTLIFGLSVLRLRADHGTNLIFSPARGALHPEKVIIDDSLTTWNKYRGDPRPELDEAWDNLLKNINIRLSASELKRINRRSPKLSDGSDTYFGQLTVYHQLHCLKSLRQAFHPEYYHTQSLHMNDHVDHCLDNLRRMAMCKADISLLTFDWVDNNRKPLGHFEVEQECYNWEAIDEWAGRRRFDLFDNKTLIHPKLGPSFPIDAQGHLIKTDDPDPLQGIVITPPVD